MNNKKLWYPAAMVIALSVAASAAQAKSLEQVGAAEGRGEPLKTYGVDVSTKSGLKTLLPTGWNLFIYKNTKLPQSMSWTVGDTWIGALEKFADTNNLAVRLDWAKKAVYVSTPEVAIETRAKLAEIDNASRTPLPAYAPAVAAPKAVPLPTAKPVVASLPVATLPAARPVVAPAASQYRPVTPAPAPTPVLSPEASRASAELLARALAATAPVGPAAVAPTIAAPAAIGASTGPAVFAGAPQVAAQTVSLPAAPAPRASAYAEPTPTTASDAFVRGNMEDIVRKSAAKLGYQVSWETVSLPLTGPVTFLGVDAAEDMRLLQKSLGLRQSPIAVEVYRGSQVIRITASSQNREPLAVYDTTYSGLIGYGPKASAHPQTRMAAEFAPAPAELPMPNMTAAHAPALANIAPVVKPAVVTPAIAPAPTPAPVLLTLKISKGDFLKKSITQFLKAEGWDLDWRLSGDLEADFPFTASGPTVALTLRELLPKLGLDADVYAPSKMVIVRPIDNTAE